MFVKEKNYYKESPKLFQGVEEEYKAYRQAVWDYFLEHCDIIANGKIFVKFHSDGKDEFEKHVKARMLYNYHRGDPVLQEAERERRKQKVVEVKKRNEELAERRKRSVEHHSNFNWFQKIVKKIWPK